ncbi:phosphoenolpyruvate carboxykinase (ATP) [Pullulanibacillus camelliae]|uniref:Phosphoenolpyruvate carboxykinase (ATP) n=1 Tax=Pullulanibacillus camelliae TaxID=1707096 RepID=A0A8J2YM20_9BACL|nr:phosphoenolpyruvate carboxykinase (ATP) [Pullulanibacillus camelliae]GGE53003.1 phosphoenolpyruvate carboxykinase (ATP) [Pullulanibacillus camelliae]
MSIAKEIFSAFDRESFKGLVHYNLSVSELLEFAVIRNEGLLTETGAFLAYTGEFTGRSPKDKFIVEDALVHDHIEWGKVNQPLSQKHFEQLYQKAMAYMTERQLFVFDGYAGAKEEHQLSIRVINEYAWHNLFARQLFIRQTPEPFDHEQSDFTIISLPGLKADPRYDGTNSETFIVISFEKKIVLIGGTEYAGEIKKSVFTILNYLLPFEGVLPMHCSANVGDKGDVALFFGLSGTGKTTLSATSERKLIGDDEHGWSDAGVFNFEGGCYAKCVGLTEENEPQIWNAIQYGSVLENVAIDRKTRQLNYKETQITENTRAAYPLEKIPNALIPSVAGHPQVIIFLTADAFGVLPPIAKLTKEQAMYHFLSGYTSKLAGTERGITEPEATFSACFGEPFMSLQPHVYAEMLGKKIDEHHSKVYLINTGWSGGPYGVGKRIKLDYTRVMVDAAITGTIEANNFREESTFGLFIPQSLPHVPDKLLNPSQAWKDTKAYNHMAQELMKLFHRNFKRFQNVSSSIREAGPKLK